MSQETIRVIYRDGIFIPQAPCSLTNHSEVELVAQPPLPQKVDIIDSETRQQILNTLLRRMRQTLINTHAQNRSSTHLS